MCWTHLSDTKPKARKKHVCYLCGYFIQQGEVYDNRVGVFDGDIVTQRMHLECEEVTRNWKQEDWEYFEWCDFRKELEAFRAKKAAMVTP